MFATDTCARFAGRVAWFARTANRVTSVRLAASGCAAAVESVVGIVLMTCERRCLVEFPTKVGWYCENQLLLAPTAGLIQAKCDELRRRWSPSDIRLVRAERERQVEVRE